MAFYRCSYILRTGEVCNRGSYRVERCQVYWYSPRRVPCKDCSKLTFSKYGTCDIYARKYRKMEQYYWKKLEKMKIHSECTGLLVEEISPKRKKSLETIFKDGYPESLRFSI
ncbi:hypothetical protein Glove_117g268 [Diversispora epigaea]|uniref:Uncharacterized protein n=1 Tax=Diversispora epigaea TaxID=1348612 RepID=A0A397J9A7_9GLOM|nr:hypothetical protein Glove_117g268 [Diversispora epigaea]